MRVAGEALMTDRVGRAEARRELPLAGRLAAGLCAAQDLDEDPSQHQVDE